MADFNFYLNRQGVKGAKGEKGDPGFSPIITEAVNDRITYKLNIQNETFSFETPNLRPEITDGEGSYIRINPEGVWYIGDPSPATETDLGMVKITGDMDFDINIDDRVTTPSTILSNLHKFIITSGAIEKTVDESTGEISLYTQDLSPEIANEVEARTQADADLQSQINLRVKSLDILGGDNITIDRQGEKLIINAITGSEGYVTKAGDNIFTGYNTFKRAITSEGGFNTSTDLNVTIGGQSVVINNYPELEIFGNTILTPKISPQMTSGIDMNITNQTIGDIVFNKTPKVNSDLVLTQSNVIGSETIDITRTSNGIVLDANLDEIGGEVNALANRVSTNESAIESLDERVTDLEEGGGGGGTSYSAGDAIEIRRSGELHTELEITTNPSTIQIENNYTGTKEEEGVVVEEYRAVEACVRDFSCDDAGFGNVYNKASTFDTTTFRIISLSDWYNCQILKLDISDHGGLVPSTPQLTLDGVNVDASALFEGYDSLSRRFNPTLPSRFGFYVGDRYGESCKYSKDGINWVTPVLEDGTPAKINVRQIVDFEDKILAYNNAEGKSVIVISDDGYHFREFEHQPSSRGGDYNKVFLYKVCNMVLYLDDNLENSYLERMDSLDIGFYDYDQDAVAWCIRNSDNDSINGGDKGSSQQVLVEEVDDTHFIAFGRVIEKDTKEIITFTNLDNFEDTDNVEYLVKSFDGYYLALNTTNNIFFSSTLQPNTFSRVSNLSQGRLRTMFKYAVHVNNSDNDSLAINLLSNGSIIQSYSIPRATLSEALITDSIVAIGSRSFYGTPQAAEARLFMPYWTLAGTSGMHSLEEYGLTILNPESVDNGSLVTLTFTTTRSSGTGSTINALCDNSTIKINSNNKLYVDPTITNQLEERINELQLYKFPNATIIGEPTINNGQISNFSTSSYLQFPFEFETKGRTWLLNGSFNTGSDVYTQQNVIDSLASVALAVRNGKLVLALSSNGTSFNLGEHESMSDIEPNTKYYFRISFSEGQYLLSLSTDKIDYMPEIIVSSSESIASKPNTISSSGYPFGGIINLNDWDLTIANLLVWQGMDDVGISTRLDVNVNNITQSGIERLKELLGIGDIDAILDAINGEVI